MCPLLPVCGSVISIAIGFVSRQKTEVDSECRMSHTVAQTEGPQKSVFKVSLWRPHVSTLVLGKVLTSLLPGPQPRHLLFLFRLWGEVNSAGSCRPPGPLQRQETQTGVISTETNWQFLVIAFFQKFIFVRIKRQSFL